MIPAAYFADASFWIALLELGDDHHSLAILWQRHINASRSIIWTTEAVLWEVLNHFSFPSARTRAVRLYRGCYAHKDVSVQNYTSDLIDDSIRLYESRPDKSWGITDCFSFETMRRHGITRALTADHHFIQAGFHALLLQDPTP